VSNRASSWGGHTINGAVGSPETHFAYTTFEGNGTTCIEVAGGTLYLDSSTFLTTKYQYVSLDSSSFLISGCYFPTTSAPFELLHGTGGISPAGGASCVTAFFGSTTGYKRHHGFHWRQSRIWASRSCSITTTFSRGQRRYARPGRHGCWVEGNIFMHSHRNGSPDSSAAISGGSYDFGAGAGGVRPRKSRSLTICFRLRITPGRPKEGNFLHLHQHTIVPRPRLVARIRVRRGELTRHDSDGNRDRRRLLSGKQLSF